MIITAVQTVRQMMRTKATPPPAMPPIKAMFMPDSADVSTLAVVSVSSRLLPIVTLVLVLVLTVGTTDDILYESMLLCLNCIEVAKLSVAATTEGETSVGNIDMELGSGVPFCSTAVV